MTDYKNTLNLPKTDFAMKGNLAKQEPIILNKWNENKLYEKIRKNNKKKKKFILHDGPPYANGHIHMGHAVNKTLKDMIMKSKILSGFDVPLIPGWDCHGLPIELNVEKKVGKPGQKISATEFRKACREYARSQINIQREQFKRLGIFADWDHPYLTMDFNYEADEVRSLAKILKNGHIQKGSRPVHWCLDCGSALAEAEVEYQEKTSPSIDVRFKIAEENVFLSLFEKVENGQGDISIPIWTTTPWTLPANQAVALNPQFNYVLIEGDNERLLIAEPLLPNILTRYGIKKHRTLGKILGEKLVGIQLQHPFYSRLVPVILGDHVTFETGTGAVHTAPAHGEDDYYVSKKYDLPLDNPVNNEGCYTANTPLFAGEHVTKVNEKIIEIMRDNKTLICYEKITHSYPHCWRHKTPLIFRATPQWFISFDKNHLREKSLAAVNTVKWIPDWGQARIASMIENRPDWCISRQRTWGVPMPLFLHRETGELHPDTLALMEKVAQKIERSGVDAWFALDSEELLGDEAEHYIKCTDTLDVWFDSGVSHDCVVEKNSDLHFPADLYLEGSDQHRGWFQSSLLTSVAIHDREPYKMVLTHGYVIDIEGRKMSKSLGNVLAPEKIINTIGADVLRLWVASIDYRGDIFVSDEILTRISETYRRLRNTARFLLANLNGFDPDQHLIKPNQMLALDRWAVDKAYRLQQDIIKAYEQYQFHIIYQKIHQFCSVDLGSFYLDIIKDRQYTTQTESIARRSAQTAMYHIIEALVRWLAPILSFTAEEIWQYIPGKRNESVFLNTWYDALTIIPEKDKLNNTFWEKIRILRDVVNKELENQRKAGNIGAPLEAEVELYCEPKLKQELDLLGDELRFILITSKAIVIQMKTPDPTLIETELKGLYLKVIPTKNPKCERCWHRRSDVGSDKSHPTICLRCVENVAGKGEIREYA